MYLDNHSEILLKPAPTFLLTTVNLINQHTSATNLGFKFQVGKSTFTCRAGLYHLGTLGTCGTIDRIIIFLVTNEFIILYLFE